MVCSARGAKPPNYLDQKITYIFCNINSDIQTLIFLSNALKMPIKEKNVQIAGRFSPQDHYYAATKILK